MQQRDQSTEKSGNNRIIAGLMVPFVSLVIHLSMFTVAVPAIRADFSLPADTTSWMLLVYTIPYILFMPLYGRLGDRLGRRRLLLFGIGLYSAGTVLCIVAPGLGVFITGRVVQAAGGASVNPLSLSIIATHFSAQRRGQAMGTWNSAGPFTGMIGPALGGIIVEQLGWRSIYFPVAVVVVVAAVLIVFLVPADKQKLSGVRATLRTFDWMGLFLTAGMLVLFVFYVSSRPLTGRMPFTDWRLLVGFLAFGFVWFFWERSRRTPFVGIKYYAKRSFALASACVSLRMFFLGGTNFLVPLLGTDVYGLAASRTGLLITLQSFALMVTMSLGGKLADGWSRRYPVMIGLFGQTASYFFFALVPPVSTISLITPVFLQGAFAGLSLGSLHHTAMHEVPSKDLGAGAGTYSMTRFFGVIFGTSLAGIILENGLQADISLAAAYQQTFLVIAIVGIVVSSLSFFLPVKSGGEVGK